MNSANHFIDNDIVSHIEVNGVIYSTYKQESINLENAIFSIGTRSLFKTDTSADLHVIVNISNLRKITRDALQYIAIRAQADYSSFAIIADTALGKFFAKVCQRMTNKTIPFEIFNNYDEALKWSITRMVA